jgi:glycosyltransferase involved in cell wall biosynthesis
MACGVPVVASELGALQSLRLDELGCGAFVPAGDVDALRGVIRSVVADPEVLCRWRSRLPAPMSVRDHATAVEGVYRRVLGVEA